MQREKKLWGERWLLKIDDLHALSYLKIKSGHRCSWHSHRAKHNLFFVLSGKVGILTEDGETILTAEQAFSVPPDIKHEFRAYEDSTMMEEMFVSYDEGDIERLDSGGKMADREKEKS